MGLTFLTNLYRSQCKDQDDNEGAFTSVKEVGFVMNDWSVVWCIHFDCCYEHGPGGRCLPTIQ